MALDFAWQRHGTVLFSVEHGELEGLRPALDMFEGRTSVYLDPYGDGRLTLEHRKVLHALLPEPSALRAALAGTLEHDDDLCWLGD